jgi:hypothetical protein
LVCYHLANKKPGSRLAIHPACSDRPRGWMPGMQQATGLFDTAQWRSGSARGGP